MELLYQGKTKDVYQLEDGSIRLLFKDSMTGKDGVFDPGENSVGLEVEGSGRAGLQLSAYFFEKLNQAGIPNHFISADLNGPSMDVRKIEVFGKGIEVICRFKAVGSFIKRFGDYIEPGTDLPAYIEITIKDDQRQDPFISKDALEILGILSADEYEEIKKRAIETAGLIRRDLKSKNLDLYDIKFEYGRDCDSNEILLIDEISGGNMRVFNEEGQAVDPLDLPNYFQ